MDGGYSKNVGLDSAIPSSQAPYFENAPILGALPYTKRTPKKS